MSPSKPRQRRKRKSEAGADIARDSNGVGRSDGERVGAGAKRARRLTAADDTNRRETSRRGVANEPGSSIDGPSGARASARKPAVRMQPSPRQIPVAAAAAPPNHSPPGNAPSAFTRLRQFARVGTETDGHPRPGCTEKPAEPAISPRATAKSCKSIPRSSESTSSLEMQHDSRNLARALGRERRKMKLLVLAAVVNAVLIAFLLSGVIYTQHYTHNIFTLERNARFAFAMEDQSAVLRREMQKHEQTQTVLKTVHGYLGRSEETAEKLRGQLANATRSHRMQIEDYKSVFRQHDQELNERIKILRGDKEKSSAAVDQAWLRMDELMEENSELSTDLRKAKREFEDDIARVQRRDKELIHTVETLTRQLKQTSLEKGRLDQMHDSLLVHMDKLVAEHRLLRHNHNQLAEVLAPVLDYTQKLQRTSEQQHSIILDLTSLAHSLHTSLELSRANLETQKVESMHAVDAVVGAHGILTEDYMHYMQLQLEQLEDEAIGAVQAVAEVAGKMEYERKVEEEGRWRSYTTEAETILGGIRAKMEDDRIIVDGIGDRSVLRAAISRRIEEGIASLRSYIHPNNHLTEEKEDDVGEARQVGDIMEEDPVATAEENEK